MSFLEKYLRIRTKPRNINVSIKKSSKKAVTWFAAFGVFILCLSMGLILGSVNISFGDVGIVGTYTAYTNFGEYRSISVYANNRCIITDFADLNGNIYDAPLSTTRKWRLAHEAKVALSNEPGKVTSPFVFATSLLDDSNDNGAIETFFFTKDTPALYSRIDKENAVGEQIVYIKQ